MKRILATGAVLMTLMLSALPAAAQSDPPYLTQMPTPAAVIQEVKDSMKSGDATQISARQVAIFTLLPLIVERLQPANRYRKTPDEVKAFDALHGRMEMDSTIYPEILDKIFSPDMRSVYNQRMGTAAFGTRSNAPLAGQAPAVVPVQAGRQDAGTLAARRCAWNSKTTSLCWIAARRM